MTHKTEFARRILSVVMLLAMLLTYIPVITFAAGASSPSVNEAEQEIYGNGTPITIEAGTNDTTSVWYMNGNQKVYIKQNANLSAWYIYGARENEPYTGDTHITMTGGKVYKVFGGGYNAQADVTGNSYVTMSGGTAEFLTGGGIFGSEIYGDSYVTMTGGTVNDVSGTYLSNIYGSVYLVVTGGTVKGYASSQTSAYNLISGGKNGIITTDAKYSALENLIVKSGSDYSAIGNPVIPSGITFTIAQGETLTFDPGEKCRVDGTLINNGTIVTYTKLSTSVSGTGQIVRKVPYIAASSAAGLRVWVNDNEVSLTDENHEVCDGKVYLYVTKGTVEANLNGSTYSGVYSNDTVELKKVSYVPVTGLKDSVPTQANEGFAIELPNNVLPENATFNQLEWKITDAGNTGATISGNVVRTKSSGTLKVQGTVKVNSAFGEDYVTPVYTIQIVKLEGGYISYTWNGDRLVAKRNDLPENRTVISQDITGLYQMETGWYYISGNITASSALVINGEVNLILEDNASLSCVTIAVQTGNTLNIYAQSVGDSMGKLVMKASNSAGVGGWGNQDTGTINIHGGNIEAKGSYGHAGIGGYNKCAAGEINIYGGIINATGGTHAAGIGLGQNTTEGSVNVFGGTITATGTSAGAGIGGTVTIYGGDIYATSTGGAGIGSRENNSSGNIVINGGTITAVASSSGAGIGSGYKGSVGTITINGGNVYASSNGGAIIGAGNGGTAGAVQNFEGKEVVLHQIAFYGMTEQSAITKMTDANGKEIPYNLYDVHTVDTNKFSFCLPADVHAAYITAGGVEYAYGGDYYCAHSYVWENILEPGCDTAGIKIQKCEKCLYVDESVLRIEKVVAPGPYPESAHNYTAGLLETKKFTYPGAVRLTLQFTAETYTRNEDYIYIYDGDDRLIGKYYGEALAGQTVSVKGNQVTITLETNYYNHAYGYSIESITADVVKVDGVYALSVPAKGHNYVEDICTACGHNRHVHSGEITYQPNENNGHTGTYSNCGHTFEEEHTVTQAATCVSGAICALCGEFGATDSSNHVEGCEISYEPTPDNSRHFEVHSKCGIKIERFHKEIYEISADGATCTVHCSICDAALDKLEMFAPECKTYGDGKSYEVYALLNGEKVSLENIASYYVLENEQWVSLGYAAPDDAGTYKAIFVVDDGGSKSEDDDLTMYVEYTIQKAALTITANDNTIVYGDAPAHQDVTFTGLVNGDTPESLAGELNYTYDYVQYGDFGTYTITPSGVTSHNYHITFLPGKLTVQQAELVLLWGNTSLVYNGERQLPSVTLQGIVNGDAILPAVSGYQTNAGTYTATVTGITGEKAANYKLPADVTVEFTIAKAQPTNIQWPTASDLVYGQTLAESTLTSADAFGTFAWKDSEIVPVVDNSGYVVVYTPADPANYDYSKVTLEQTVAVAVAKAPLTVTANDYTIVYGDAPEHRDAIISGFVNQETAEVLAGELTYTFDYARYGDVGVYRIVPAGLTAENYAITFVPGELTVLQAELEILWEGTDFVYNGESQLPKATFQGALNADVLQPEISGQQVNAGTYTATVTGITGEKAANYKLPADVTVEFTIAKATPVVENVIAVGDVYDSTRPEAVVLAGDVSVPGVLTLTDADLIYGVTEYNWLFTPEDVTNYETVTGKVQIEIVDPLPPSVTIMAAQNVWTDFAGDVTFGVFCGESVPVVITCEDNIEGSGVAAVYYYVSGSALTEAELENVNWIAYNGQFTVEAAGNFVVYVKASDNAGNMTIAHTDGIILDRSAPVISLITDGGIYYGNVGFAFEDDLAGIAKIEIDGVEQALDLDNYGIVADNAAHTVAVTDKAGNATNYTITVYKIYVVQFRVNGLPIAAVAAGHGQSVELPEIPWQEGYDQVAPVWDHDGQNITGDLVIHAIYTPNVLAGDCNLDGNVDNDDVLTLLWHCLFPEENPVEVPGDLNADDKVDNDDVLTLLWHCLFPEENPL